MKRDSNIMIVSSIEAFLRSSVPAGAVMQLERPNAIGDFRALANWIEKECSDSSGDFEQRFSADALQRMAGRMPEAERFAVRQVIADLHLMNDQGANASLLATDSGFGPCEMRSDQLGRFACFYTRPISGMRLTDFWRGAADSVLNAANTANDYERGPKETLRLMLQIL